MTNKKKICFIANLDSTILVFLVNHLRRLAIFYDLTIITNTINNNFLLERGIKAKIVQVKFSRKVNLLSDFFCFIKLFNILRENKFSSVHSITPKAGFIAMLTSFLVGVPLRFHTFTGQVWVTKSGFSRLFLKYTDKLIAVLSTHCIVDSPSQKDFLVTEKVLPFNKAIVFRNGSVAGVDLLKFKPNRQLGKITKKELAIPSKSFVYIYLGRFTRDKGLFDLARAFSQLKFSDAYLIMVGSDEEHLSPVIKKLCASKIENIRLLSFTNNPYKYLACSDVLCLPSYREGFGTVIIEAAAMGIPAIASKIYGITDATIHNRTGLLHHAGDIASLKLSMEKVLQDKRLFKRLQDASRKRAIKKFDSKNITSEWINFYKQQLT